MRNFLWLLVFVVLSGCSKDTPAPVFTSPDGTWTYTTPDNAITVTFDLKKNSSNALEISNTSIKVNDITGEAVGFVTGVNLPNVNEIKVQANDAVLIYPSYISFINCTFNTAFTQIHANDAVYVVYASGTPTSTPLTSVTVTRK